MKVLFFPDLFNIFASISDLEMFSRLIYQPKDFASRLRNVRSYYKPKQKDAFFDVEGVVNKDLVLFR